MNAKNILKKIENVVVVCCLVLLTGCGPKDVRFFPRVKTHAAAVVTKQELDVVMHALSRQECDAYFGVDVIAEGVRPLLLTIQNRSADAYVVRPSYIPLTRISGKEVAQLMHYDTYQRVFWLTWPALIFWWPAIPCLVVPYGFGCQHYNKKTTKTLRKMTLGAHDVLDIAPYETVQRFIFVPDASFKTVFDMKLYNETKRVLEILTVTSERVA